MEPRVKISMCISIYHEMQILFGWIIWNLFGKPIRAQILWTVEEKISYTSHFEHFIILFQMIGCLLRLNFVETKWWSEMLLSGIKCVGEQKVPGDKMTSPGVYSKLMASSDWWRGFRIFTDRTLIIIFQ